MSDYQLLFNRVQILYDRRTTLPNDWGGRIWQECEQTNRDTDPQCCACVSSGLYALYRAG